METRMTLTTHDTLPGSPVPFPNDPEATPQLAATMGVNASEWERMVKALGRTPTFAELGVFSVMWSEHCSYKIGRAHV